MDLYGKYKAKVHLSILERLKVWEWGEETASIKRDKKREKRVAVTGTSAVKGMERWEKEEEGEERRGGARSTNGR